MFKIHINNIQDESSISIEDVKKTVDKIFNVGDLEKDGELSITLVDDEKMVELNKEYRGMDSTTDVLAFSQDEGFEILIPKDTDFVPLIGDIFVSVSTAARQAREMGHSLDREMNILLIHGILHLYGYDHENVYQETFMKEEEKAILSALETKKEVKR
jgi:probable rRNA maturation factor